MMIWYLESIDLDSQNNGMCLMNIFDSMCEIVSQYLEGFSFLRGNHLKLYYYLFFILINYF